MCWLNGTYCVYKNCSSVVFSLYTYVIFFDDVDITGCEEWNDCMMVRNEMEIMGNEMGAA